MNLCMLVVVVVVLVVVLSLLCGVVGFGDVYDVGCVCGVVVVGVVVGGIVVWCY